MMLHHLHCQSGMFCWCSQSEQSSQQFAFRAIHASFVLSCALSRWQCPKCFLFSSLCGWSRRTATSCLRGFWWMWCILATTRDCLLEHQSKWKWQQKIKKHFGWNKLCASHLCLRIEQITANSLKFQSCHCIAEHQVEKLECCWIVAVDHASLSNLN